MPYRTVDELPDAVKKLPTPELREAWMKAYNAAHEQYKGDEGKANATAWSAIGKMGYVKKGDAWVKAEYVKDLALTPGEYLHPDNPDKKLNITEADLMDIVSNTQKVLDAGGHIPLTVSHPKNERDKITLNEGDILGVWYDPAEQRPYMAFSPSATVKGWIDTGKLQAVSPGIYYDVVTSIGKLPSMLDHVAVTNSPFVIGQSGFTPVTAEQYGRAVLFFEQNKYISHEQGGNVLDMVKALYEKFIGKSTTQEGGRKMELEQIKAKYAELEAQSKKDVADRDATIQKLQTENDALKKIEADRLTLARKTAIDAATAKIDKLILEKKVEPKNRDKLLQDFTTLYDNKIEGADEILFARFEATKPAENTLKHGQILVEKEVININTPEGADKWHDLQMARAKELSDASGGKKSVNQCFEQAHNELCAKFGLNQ